MSAMKNLIAEARSLLLTESWGPSPVQMSALKTLATAHAGALLDAVTYLERISDAETKPEEDELWDKIADEVHDSLFMADLRRVPSLRSISLPNLVQWLEDHLKSVDLDPKKADPWVQLLFGIED